MRAVVVERWQDPDKLKVSEIAKPELCAGSLLIKVKAAGANFFDILLVQGKYQTKPAFPFTPGSEFSGEVEEVGGGVEGFKKGDKVYGSLPFGAYAEYVVVDATAVLHLPKGMNFVEGAAFGMVYPTSYAGLVHRANLLPKETLLVHAAAGGVGTAAVQIGRAIGATVIATVGSSAKVEIAKQAGAHHVIDLSKEDLVSAVKKLTDDKGADVVYDPVGGDLFDKSTSCTAWNGRILVVGFASGTIPAFKTNRALLKSISVVGLFWGAMMIREPEKAKDTFDALLALYSRGLIRPIIYPDVYDLEDLPKTLAVLGSRKSYGKLIVRIDKSLTVKSSNL
eukprot:Phypoly_transcript_11305.p1 GENE.Phypoly_transcript_11305~~Phypoly_transcript_11305.p1  ORF type:complete len:337 (+),score=54.53 Phypoly_transcript_11305:193-1203(+)